MAANDAAVEFGASLESVLKRIPEERIRIILQMMGASVDTTRLDRLQQALDRIPEDSKRKNAFKLGSIPEQFAAVIPQIVALELDRVTPLRVLGIGRNVAHTLFCAKVLGHDVVMACRKDFSSKWSLWLYQLPHVDGSKPADLPEGRFNLIVAAGAASLATKQAWANFLGPLTGKLADDGRIFTILAREPDPKRNYSPQMVMTKLARIGARVSSKHHFVLLDRAAIAKFEAGHSGAIDPAGTLPDDGDAAALAGRPQDADRIPDTI